MDKSTRPWKGLHHRVSGREDYGQYYDLAAALIYGPRTLEEIKGHYESYLRLLGIFTPLTPFDYEEEEWDEEIKKSLIELEKMGWAEKENDRWRLTEGRKGGGEGPA